MRKKINRYFSFFRRYITEFVQHNDTSAHLNKTPTMATRSSENDLLQNFWEQKDWYALTKFSASDISNTSERATSAFMIAIAHAKVNDSENYHLYSRLAVTWLITNEAMSNLIGDSYFLKNKPKFTPRILSTMELGQGWSSNTINTAIYRHHGVVTVGSYQFTAFYSDDKTINICRISEDRRIEHFKLEGNYRLKDAHNSISLGFDNDHHLHITYDHHGTKLKYRRTTAPYDVNSWGPETSMTGINESRVTYPTFINPRHNHPLTLIYRDGQWDRGCVRIKTFDEAKGQWFDLPTAIISGEDNAPWTSNAYWNHPAVGSDGSLHMSFVWRTHSIGPELKVNNINICYALSYDNGATWQTSQGHPFKIPITPVNSETIFAVSPASNLMNQCSMALDSLNMPHIAYYMNDADGIPQYFHLWQTQKGWQCRQLTFRASPFQLQGVGTLQLPISRPEIVIDSKDNVHIIFRADITAHRMAVISLQPPFYEAVPDGHEIIFPMEIGYSEPIIDRSKWEKDGVLSIFLQKTDQPNGDVSVRPTQSRVILIDVEIN